MSGRPSGHPFASVIFVQGDPNGAVRARLGTLGVDYLTGNVYKNTDGSSAWSAFGGVADGDKGDITVTASGATWTIDAGSVTLAKQADIAQQTILGRSAFAGTGAPQALTPSQVTQLVALSSGDAFTALRGNGAWGSPDKIFSRTGSAAIANVEGGVIDTVLAAGFPANTLQVGDCFRFSAAASQAGAGAGTPTARVRIGPVLLTGAIAASVVGVPGGAGTNLTIVGTITIRATGAAGSAIGELTATSPAGVAIGLGSAAVAIDTTVANLIGLTFISGDAANTFTFQTGVLQYLRI